MEGKDIKVGMKVRLTSTIPFAGLVQGQIGQVTDIYGDGIHNGFYVNGRAGCQAAFWEAVEAEGVEKLVEIANAGYRAIEELRKNHSSEVEYGCDGEPYSLYSTTRKPASGRNFRLKPKPNLAPFVVGGAWKVEMKRPSDIQIGCKNYVASALKSDLERASEMGQGKNYILSATKNGIKDPDGHVISWADVEKLLEALNKMGV